jgi:hypothetical protein
MCINNESPNNLPELIFLELDVGEDENLQTYISLDVGQVKKVLGK